MQGATLSTRTAVEPGGTHPGVLGDWAARKGSGAPDPAWDTPGVADAGVAAGGAGGAGAGR